jgi:hypothetical protein
VAAHDPNALYGPTGKGLYVLSGALNYQLDFENDGTAPAQTVTASEQLDPNFDWSTFQLGSFGFGPVNITVPAGLTQYQTIVPYENEDGTSLDVKVNLNFNVQTGLLSASYASIDPLTGQAPTGAFDGFLPPDNSSGIGEGFVQYTVQPKSGLASGATISGQASVVFDTNGAIQTNTVTNTIDATPPTSSVNPLPAIVNSPSFTVSWSGSDANGPGIATYNVYVSDNGGPFSLWLAGTTQTSATFTGQVGHHYSFYSVATDQLGLTQPTPTSAQATTYVFVPAPPPPAPPAPPPAPPTLQVPPLLAFFDALFGGIETINSNGTETVIDSLFGIPLFVATFDSSGGLESVTLFGINITFLFE